MAANRTILILEGLPMAHLKAYVPYFFKTPAKKVIIFKIVGASPLQSQVIQNLDTQKRCFLGTFFEKIAILTHFDQTNPPP